MMARLAAVLMSSSAVLENVWTFVESAIVEWTVLMDLTKPTVEWNDMPPSHRNSFNILIRFQLLIVLIINLSLNSTEVGL